MLIPESHFENSVEFHNVVDKKKVSPELIGE
jgi:hypothetical protein